MLYVLFAAALASIIAGAITLRLVFGREFLADFDDNGFPLLLIMLTYAIVPGVASLLVVNGLLRISPVSKVRDLLLFVGFTTVIGLLLFFVLSGFSAPAGAPAPATSFQPMAAYQTVSAAIGGLLFWLLSGRWRTVRNGTAEAANG